MKLEFVGGSSSLCHARLRGVRMPAGWSSGMRSLGVYHGRLENLLAGSRERIKVVW